MTAKSDILIELEGIAPLLALEKIPVPYQVPGEYFTLFADGMLDKVHQAHHSFSVPDGYFEGFAVQMLQKVRANEVTEELKEVAPILNSISKAMPFYLPEGYFENFVVNRPQATAEIPARVISLFGKKLKTWAAAAAIIFTLGLSWMYFSNQSANPEYTATLTGQEMDSLLNNMESGNLNGLLENEGTANEFTSLLLAAQEGVEKSVQTLSTEELSGYLENYSIAEPGS